MWGLHVAVHGPAQRQICGVGGWLEQGPPFQSLHDKNRASLEGASPGHQPEGEVRRDCVRGLVAAHEFQPARGPPNEVQRGHQHQRVPATVRADLNRCPQRKSGGDISTSGYLQQSGQIRTDAMNSISCSDHEHREY